MKIYYNISDFNISGDPIPEKIADKILHHHLIPMSIVQGKSDFKIYPSFDVPGQPSSFRPYIWEIAKGRSGTSQHTFGQKKSGLIYNADLGATDWTCENFQENKDALLDLMIKETNYIRLAVYNTFIHADYKNSHNGRRLLFTSNSSSEWTFIKFI